MIENDRISEDAKVRLVLLYALRYERMPNNQIKSLIDMLDSVGVSEKKSAVSWLYPLMEDPSVQSI